MYRAVVKFYAVGNVLKYFDSCPEAGFGKLSELSAQQRVSEWVNLGGQLMQRSEVDALRADIASGKLSDWDAVHARYDEIWEGYREEKLAHSVQCLAALYGRDRLEREDWLKAIEEERRVSRLIADQVYLPRLKDYKNPFRRATYRSEEEMLAAIGSIEDNGFVKQVRRETEEESASLDALIEKLK